MITLPGLIDPHVHLRTPGQEHKEDFRTGSEAALAGGFTYILDMPNNKEPIVTADRLNAKIAIAEEKAKCAIGFYFGSLGDNFDEFPKVYDKVFGLKLYLNETTGNFLINTKKMRAIFEAWESNKPILVHAEDLAVAEVLTLVKRLGKKVHFCHISTAEDLQQIIKAKQKGLPITAGVTPHHLFLTEVDIKKLGPFGLMKPTLRSKKDQDFLWNNLSWIDIVESDHAPHTIAEKKSDTPPFGVPGLETTLPLLLTAVHDKRMTLDDVIDKCYTQPRKIFNIPLQKKTKVTVDYVQYEIKNSQLKTKCKWSPFNGKKVWGRVKSVTIEGVEVYNNGSILV